MFSLNRIQLIGYLTQPVELRQTPGGTNVADLNIATPYTYSTVSGETLSGTGFHTVTVWSGLADVAAQYAKPGSQVFVSGRLQTDSWDDEKTNEKRSKTKIVAMDMILLDPRDGQMDPPNAPQLVDCLNRVDVIGNLTFDPEIRTTTNGQTVTTFNVASNERWRDKASSEMKERTEFHRVVVWGDMGAVCGEHIKKGNRVFASGRLQTRTWETQQGSKRTTTEIIADKVSLLGVKNTNITFSDQSSANAQPVTQTASASAPSQDIPAVQYESEVKVEDLPF